MRATVRLPILMLLSVGACAPGERGVRAADALARELAGRTAGPAANCVPILTSASLRAANRQTIVYRSGDAIWVNRLDRPCPGLRESDPLIVEPTGSQYCRGDRIRSLDPVSGTSGPICILEAFVPYRD